MRESSGEAPIFVAAGATAGATPVRLGSATGATAASLGSGGSSKAFRSALALRNSSRRASSNWILRSRAAASERLGGADRPLLASVARRRRHQASDAAAVTVAAAVATSNFDASISDSGYRIVLREQVRGVRGYSSTFLIQVVSPSFPMRHRLYRWGRGCVVTDAMPPQAMPPHVCLRGALSWRPPRPSYQSPPIPLGYASCSSCACCTCTAKTTP